MRKVLEPVLLLLLVLLTSSAVPIELEAVQQPQVTAQDVYDYINNTLEASAQTKAILIQAFQKGFAEGAITPERADQLLRAVNESGAELEFREQVLLTIADALLKSVPVEMLVNKVLEGLHRGAPMSVILEEIQERKKTLEEVKALLEGKGFKVGVELRIGGVTLMLSFELWGLVTTEIAGALEDYVRNGNDPTDSLAVRQAVLLRLQRNRSIPQPLKDWVAASIPAEELARIAQNIKARLEAPEEG